MKQLLVGIQYATVWILALVIGGFAFAADTLPSVSTFSWTEVILALACVGFLALAAWFVVKHNETPSSGETLLSKAHTEAAKMHADMVGIVTSMLARATPVTAPAKVAEPTMVIDPAIAARAELDAAQRAFAVEHSAPRLSALNAAFAKYTALSKPPGTSS